MDDHVLSDPSVYPSDEVLLSHLRRAKASFDALFEYNHKNFPEFVERWKFYNDGKQWLMNVSQKKKTVFWLSVRDGSFRTTFYLNAKAAPRVDDLAIPKILKAEFKKTATQAFRGLTIVLKAKKDVDIYEEVLRLKLATL